MRKTGALLALTAVFAAMAIPASAAPKKIHDTFGASLLPFPNYSSSTATTRPGCSAGQEGAHWVGHEFTAPAAGTMKLYMEGFTGDHDVYVLEGDIAMGRGDQAQVPDGAPPEEEIVLPMKAKQKFLLVACNWLGQPDVLAHYEFTFKK